MPGIAIGRSRERHDATLACLQDMDAILGFWAGKAILFMIHDVFGFLLASGSFRQREHTHFDTYISPSNMQQSEHLVIYLSL